jgi:pimeloyl-ACP methyl ester carboxylesterase
MSDARDSLLPLDAWRAAGGWHEWQGHRVFTCAAGDAAHAALLLIHGFPTASWDWSALWPALSSRWYVLALDLLGFGYSAKPRPHAYSIRAQADLCEHWLRARGVDRYHVLAHDYGDSVAQELLARQDEAGSRPRLQSLAFLNGGLFPEAHRPRLIQRALASPFGPLLVRAVGRRQFGASMRRIFGPDTPPSARELDGFWQLIEHGDGRAVLPALLGYLAERRAQRPRWTGALQTTRLPLRLIDGSADPVSGAHLAQRYRALLPHADVIELPRIGHYPHVEAPQAVLQAYLAFRARIAAT